VFFVGHALVQDAHDQDARVLVQVEDDVTVLLLARIIGETAPSFRPCCKGGPSWPPAVRNEHCYRPVERGLEPTRP
jgi:hypothetical protein